MLPAIGVMACGEFCETGEPVSDAFDGAEPDGTCADSRQDCFSALSSMGKQFTVETSWFKVRRSQAGDFAGDSKLKCGSERKSCSKLPHSKFISSRRGRGLRELFRG